jgi:hypothetical protein
VEQRSMVSVELDVLAGQNLGFRTDRHVAVFVFYGRLASTYRNIEKRKIKIKYRNKKIKYRNRRNRK